MKRGKILKISLLITLMVLAGILVPMLFSSALTQNDLRANLLVLRLREGGAESSGTLTDEQKAFYDETRYEYTIGDTDVFKIVEEGDNNYLNALYCLDCTKSFPGQFSGAIEYANIANFYDSTDPDVRALKLSVLNADDQTTWNSNYNALVWLFDNAFLEKQTPEQKDTYLEKAFADYTDLDMDTIKALLTDDDIDVIQQYAMWHFTNGDSAPFSNTSIGAVKLKSEAGAEGSYNDLTGMITRQELANYLYQYLISSAEKNAGTQVTYPSIVNKSTGKTTVQNGFYVAGPFEVKSGNVNNSEYALKLVDQDGNEISKANYNIVVDGTISSNEINQIFDTPFYIHINTNSNISKVKLVLDYNKYVTEASVWKATGADEDTFQPAALLTRDSVSVHEEKDFDIIKIGNYDLELLKQDKDTKAVLSGAEFSVQVNNDAAQTYTTDNNGILTIPTIDVTEVGTDTIKITETKAPNGYKVLNGTLELEVNKIESNGSYIVDSINVTTPQADMTATLNNNKISIVAENEKITGSYDLELLKQDKDTKTVLSGAEFTVQVNNDAAQTYTTDNNGILTIPTIDITEVGTDTIKVTETKAPDGYKTLNGTLELEVNKVDSNGSYIADSINVITAQAEMTATLNNNKISIVVDNEKITGSYDLELLKQDKDTKTVLSGAEFTVQVNNDAAQTYTTDNNGILTIPTIDITDVGTDTIKVTETKAPDGYKTLNGTLELEVNKVDSNGSYIADSINVITAQAEMTATLNNNKISIVVDNEKITGSYDLELLKQDKDTKTVLSGAEFTVQVNNDAAQTYTTDNNGILTIPTIDITEVGTDTIKVTETKAPEGYKSLNGTLELEVTKVDSNGSYIADSINVITAQAEMTATLNNNKISIVVDNEKITGSYDLELLKQDKDTKTVLSGAEFTVQVNNDAAQTYTTDNNGILTIPTIDITEVGTDTIKVTETKAPEGYKSLNGTLELEVTKVDSNGSYIADSINVITAQAEMTATLNNNKISIVVDNEKITGSYDLELLKQDKDTKTVLSGAEFTVQVNNDAAQTYTTDNNGILTIPTIDITEVGTDTIKVTETKAPEGYKSLNGTLELEVTKVDSNGSYVADSINVITAQADMTATLNNNKISIVVDNEKEIISGSYEIELLKQDKGTNASLSGAEFSIQINNDVARTYTTNANGVITIPTIDITEEGTDTIKVTETKAPIGYKLLNGSLVFEVTKTQVDTSYVASNVTITTSQANMTATLNNNKVTIIAQNEKEPVTISGNYGIELLKQDKDTKEVLSGVEFTVQINDGIEKTYTTNANGIISIPIITIKETGTDVIKITEVKAPNGYKLLNEVLEIEVTKTQSGNFYVASDLNIKSGQENMSATLSNSKVSIVVDNEKISGNYELELLKQDKKTGLPLSGAEFSIQVNDDVARTYTTDENGILTIPTIDIAEVGIDTVKVTETKAPEGYKSLNGTLELEVTKVVSNDAYVADSINVKTAQEDMTATLNNNKITIVAENEKETILGEYEFELLKQDKETGLPLSGAEFSVKINNEAAKTYTTDENGIIKVPAITIDKIGTDTIKVTETKAPEGYKRINGTLELEVIKIESDGYYVADSMNVKTAQENMTATFNDNKITVIAENEIKSVPGEYELEIVKTDEKGNTITDLITKFDINGEEKETENGIVKVAFVDIDETNVDTIDKYTIVETQAPDEYSKFEGTIDIEVSKKMSDDEKAYEVDKVTMKVTDKDGNTFESDDIEVITENGTTKIIVKVKNYQNIDLSLRKFITAISKDETFETDEYLKDDSIREPIVDLKDLDNGNSTTAKYNHTKDPIKVSKKDYILFTIRVYNEGNTNGYATEVTDYLPEGLEFVKDAKENDIWDYDEATRKLTTNENYKAKLLLAHEEEKELSYQDLQVVCIVSDNAPENTNIVNIAEITESKHEDGTIAKDRDSETDNLDYPDDVPGYNGGEDKDKNDEYIPGQEDDDDFERVIIESELEGKYELEIVKTDEKGNTIKDLVTKFKVNGKETETKDGIIKFEDVEITKDNLDKTDKYEIIETQAPDEYSKFEGTINIEVSKKVSDDKKAYEVDKATMKVTDKDGDTFESKDIEVKTENGTTKIIVKVKNYQNIDLSLRKFITAISKDETFDKDEYLTDKTSREPIVDLEDLDSGDSTTAKYNHTKDPIKVSKKDYILFTIRVYNEGNTNGYATEVTDYLPEGLEFVKDAKENDIWDYDETTRKLTTNENYKAKLLLAHEEGKELSYQDLQVVCIVSDKAPEDTNIVNIAEITESKHEDGTIAKDRDSETDNLDYPDDVPGYNGGEDKDKKDEYIPGQEDDDDFERVVIESEKIEGEYELEIVKTDEDGKTITDLVTKFSINGKETETKKGIVNITDIKIDKDNLNKTDKFVIKETQAPDKYSKFDGTIDIEVSKKLAKDKKSYEIDEAKITVKDKDGKVDNSKEKVATIDVVKEKETTKIVVKVVNYKAPNPEKPQEPSKPQEPETPKTPVVNPSTGDIIPVVAIGVISIVILINIVQIVISKKKNNKLK